MTSRGSQTLIRTYLLRLQPPLMERINAITYDDVPEERGSNELIATPPRTVG